MKLPRTRSEAIERGFKRYFTGVPCGRGHISVRSTGNGGCMECSRWRNETTSSAKGGHKPGIGDGLRLANRILVMAKNKISIENLIKKLPQHSASNIKAEINNLLLNHWSLEAFKDGSVQSRIVIDDSGRPVFGKNRNMAMLNTMLEGARNRLRA